MSALLDRFVANKSPNKRLLLFELKIKEMTVVVRGERCRVLVDGKWVEADVVRVRKDRIYASYGDEKKRTGSFPPRNVWKKKKLIKRQRGGGVREVINTPRHHLGRRRPSIDCVYPGEIACTKKPAGFCQLIDFMKHVPCRFMSSQTTSVYSLTTHFAHDLLDTTKDWFQDPKEFELLCPNLGVSPFLHPARHSVPCVYLYESDTSDLSLLLRQLYCDVVQARDAAANPGLPKEVLQRRWIMAAVWHISTMTSTINEKAHCRVPLMEEDMRYKLLDEISATCDGVFPSLPLVCAPSTPCEWWLGLNTGDKRYTYKDILNPHVKLEVVVRLGDITKYDGRPATGHRTAIVNAANSLCLGGGGVDGCIHRAAGPDLLRECASLPLKNSERERCLVGEAVLTSGHRLHTNHIIHAVGPRFSLLLETMDEKNDNYKLLCDAYRSIVRHADTCDLHELAIPLISNGIFRGKQVPADVIRCGISALLLSLREKVQRPSGMTPHPVHRVIIYGFTQCEFQQINDAIVTLLPESELKKAASMLYPLP